MKSEWWKDAFEKGWYPLSSIAGDWTTKTRAEANSIKEVLRLPKGSSVLDVGCGVGRHSIALAKLGYQVTGIDISPAYLKEAKANAKREGVKIRFLKMDMRRLDFAGEFDAAINLFSSFGYFKKSGDDLLVLRGIVRSLNPGGVFLIDNMDFSLLKKNFRSSEWSQLGDGSLVLERREPVDFKTQVLKTHWLFVSPRGNRSEMHSEIRGYTQAQLTALFRKAGFKNIRRLQALGPQAKLRTSFRLVLSARV